MSGETPRRLWAYRTTKRIPIGETLFSLAYETEAIISTDISMSILRVVQEQNDALLCLMLDYSEKR